MRKNGWQLPYHPLQVVAIAVFLALGFAFYVFFAPFVGKKLYQYVVLAFYTPLVACVFCLYFWCAATDPADSGVFRSKRYIYPNAKEMKSSVQERPVNTSIVQGEDDGDCDISDRVDKQDSSNCKIGLLVILPGWFALSCFYKQHSHDQTSEQQVSEDGMLYCSLCKVEVFKDSKHCRVCDKCVDGFDHHCRWLNNCIGKENYRRFFILMISVLLLIILQWSVGIFVMIMSLRERKQFTLKIISNLGNSFSLVPYVVVVATCTFLAMVATIPVAQLLFFHILLIKKGISTYEYIIALREQEQQPSHCQQSPQISLSSSATAASSAGSLAIQHGAWCTPPPLFLEDQVDVVPRESVTALKLERKILPEQSSKRRAAPVRISPWTLARLDGKDISRVASQARKKSKTHYPVVRKNTLVEQETDSSNDSTSGRVIVNFDNIGHFNKMAREELGESGMTLGRIGKLSSPVAIVSSPDCSSTELRLFRVPNRAEEAQGTTSILPPDTTPSMSENDGYDASEDSDRVPSRIVRKSFQWTSLLLDSDDLHA